MCWDENQRYIVLSFGRSGSMLIVGLLSKILGSHPIFVKSQTLDSIPTFVQEYPLEPATLQHSHLYFLPKQLQGHVKCFSLRRNTVDCVISTLLSQILGHWHNPIDSTPPSLKPFKFGNWFMLDHICRKHQFWHKFYLSQLCSTDLVFFLEDLKSHIPRTGSLYNETFPNKRDLILNYDQLVDQITPYLDDMNHSVAAFAQHHNNFDVYKSIMNQ